MYDDILLKTQFYKEQITKKLILSGLAPDPKTVQAKLDQIDLFLSIFRYSKNTPGAIFDTDKFNRDLFAIYKDLEFLYQLVYQTAIVNYFNTKAFVDTHILELEDLALKYSIKAKLEMNHTSLGKTIYFANSGYNKERNHNTTTIHLGSIQTKAGALLSCSCDLETPIDDVKFAFKKDGVVTYALPMQISEDQLRAPGEPTMKSYSLTLPDHVVNSEFSLPIKDFTPVSDYSYLVFGGKNKISVHSTAADQGVEYIAKEANNNCFIPNASMIEFYIYNGSYAMFSFSAELTNKNFPGYQLPNLDQFQRITIECANQFAFDFTTDGDVYAVKQIGQIKNNTLIYPQPTTVRDFLICEFSSGAPYTYDNVSIDINAVDNPVIRSIAIKELNPLQAVLL